MRWIVAGLLMLLPIGSAQAYDYGRVDHSGNYIVVVSTDEFLTADMRVYALRSTSGWQDQSDETPVPASPVPIDQLAYWSRTMAVDTSGNGWQWLGGGPNYWVNLGQIPGFVPSGITMPAAEVNHLDLRAQPNPSQRAATISYVLPEKTEVLVQVNDVTGRVVDVLVNQWQVAGTYSQLWEPRDAPAGIYFVVLIAQGEMRASKVVLTK